MKIVKMIKYTDYTIIIAAVITIIICLFIYSILLSSSVPIYSAYRK